VYVKNIQIFRYSNKLKNLLTKTTIRLKMRLFRESVHKYTDEKFVLVNATDCLSNI